MSGLASLPGWVLPAEAALVGRIARDIRGWLTPAEGAWLYAAAARGPGAGAVVEIGSNRGKSTALLAHASLAAERGPVHSIDPHRSGTEQELRRNLAREQLSEHVVVHVTRSQELATTWGGGIRLLFIDGDHSFAGARADYLGWKPLVVPGGVIALHDTTTWDGPRRVVDELVLADRDVRLIAAVDSLVAVQVLLRATPRQRLRHVALRAARRLVLATHQGRLTGELHRLGKRAARRLSRPPDGGGASLSAGRARRATAARAGRPSAPGR